MDSAASGTMTGVNKQVTVNFVILKLLGHQFAWAEINDEVPYDEEAAKEAAMQWAIFSLRQTLQT